MNKTLIAALSAALLAGIMVPSNAAVHHAAGTQKTTGTAAKHNTACVAKHMGRSKSVAAHNSALKWCMAHNQY